MHRAAALLCLCIAAWVILIAETATASPTAGRSEGIRPGSFVVLTAPATHGFQILIEGSNRHVTLSVGDGTRTTGYKVAGSLSSGRLRARFGRLGAINVDFKPTRVLPVERPGGGCGGIVSQFELGVFTGSIRFRGERGYVNVDSSRARGEVVNSIRYDCADPPPTVRHSSHRTLDERVWALNRLERESEHDHRAVLDVRNGKPDGNRVLLAIATKHGGAIGPTYFFGGLIERRRAIRIFRVGAVKAPPSSFQFDLAAGNATVTPPSPFSGTASLTSNADGTKSWSGTLAVDLLGAEPAQLVGHGLKPFLGADFDE